MTEEKLNWRSMTTAPRDGTRVVILERGYPGYPDQEREARVVMSWPTDEFIPVEISETDSAGMNHGAIPEEHALGWRPLITMIEIHTEAEIDAEIERLRPMLAELISTGEVRPYAACIESDLRVAAYNRLTERNI